MEESVFLKAEFAALIIFSLAAPFAIYLYLVRIRTIARFAVLLFGAAMMILAALDVYLLQVLAVYARESASVLDDKIFGSELSTALYIFPALFAGIGVNIISHVLIAHLQKAEGQYDREHKKLPH